MLLFKRRGGPFDYTLGGTLTLFAGFVGWRAGAFWQDAAQTVPANVGDPIESWREIYSGANRHATQAVLAAKPTVILTAAGRLGASFDGIDDFLQTAAFAAVAQPTMIYAVQKIIVVGGNQKHICDGIAGASRHVLYHDVGTNNLSMYAGGGINSAVATANMIVVTGHFNGATSRLWRDGTLIAGPANAGANTLTGVTLGASDSGANPFDGQLLAYLGYPGTHTDVQRNAIIAALTAEAGI